MLISKSDFINLCKSMGKDPEFEKLRAEVLSILKKQAKTEGNEKDIHKSLLEMDKSFKYFDKDEFIIKSGYPVGTIREWKGRKYIKVAPNKWKPKYDSESKGAKNSITRLMKQVENCKNVEELMNLVMENKQRFTDANGNHLPIVDKLRAAADKKNDSLSSGKNSNVVSKKEQKADKKQLAKEEDDDRKASREKLKKMNQEWETVIPEMKKMIKKYGVVEIPLAQILFEKHRDFYEKVMNIFNRDAHNFNYYTGNLAIQMAREGEKEKTTKVDKDTPKAEESEAEKYYNEEYEYYKNNLSEEDDLETIKNDLEKEKRNAEKKNDTKRLLWIKAKEKVIEEIEAEKHKNRSDAMKGNKNAYKGYLSEEKVNHVGKMNYEVYEERNTDKDVFAAHHKDGQFKGISMNQDIAKMIDSMKPGFDGEEEVAKEIHEKYPAVKESYLKQMLRYISMGVGKSRKPARVFVHDEETKKNDETKEEALKVLEKKESKTSTKASNNTSSAYAPSESTDLESKTVIASNKSIGESEVEMPYSKELDAEIKSLNNFRSSDETRKFLTSVYYDNGNLVSTDARRLKTIKVGKLEGIPNGSYVDVTSGKDGVKIKVKEVENSDGSKAKFPDYTNVIHAENNQKVTLDNTTLKDKLKTMLKDGSIDKKVGRVALEFKDGGVFLDGTKVGNASGINLKYERWRESDIATNSININANYLLDALAGDESIMMLSDNQNKAISIATGSTNNIIMPMQPVDESDPNKLPDYEAGRKAKAEADKYKADLRNVLIEGNKKHYEEAAKEIENVSSDKVISNITDLNDDKLASIWDLGNMPIDKLHAVNDWTKNEKLTKVSSNYYTILKHHYIMQRPEVRDAIETEMKKRGLDTSIRKSLFDDIDFEDDVEKSIYSNGPELFESVNIAETVRIVLSEII